MKILITGFEPFGGETENPSWAVGQLLHGYKLQECEITSVQLPCVFSQSLAALELALKLHQPQIVLALGQADGRSDLSVERVGINVCDARIADNEGAQPVDIQVVENGPAAYFQRCPLKRWWPPSRTMDFQLLSHKPRALLFATKFSMACNIC